MLGKLHWVIFISSEMIFMIILVSLPSIRACFETSPSPCFTKFQREKTHTALGQCREEGAYALENAAKSREVVPISSDLRSEATEEEGIGSTSRDEVAFLVCMHPPHGINIVIKKKNSDM